MLEMCPSVNLSHHPNHQGHCCSGIQWLVEAKCSDTSHFRSIHFEKEQEISFSTALSDRKLISINYFSLIWYLVINVLIQTHHH